MCHFVRGLPCFNSLLSTLRIQCFASASDDFKHRLIEGLAVSIVRRVAHILRLGQFNTRLQCVVKQRATLPGVSVVSTSFAAVKSKTSSSKTEFVAHPMVSRLPIPTRSEKLKWLDLALGKIVFAEGDGGMNLLVRLYLVSHVSM